MFYKKALMTAMGTAALSMCTSALADKIDSAYFSLEYKSPWALARPIVDQDGAYIAMLVNEKTQNALTIALREDSLSAKDVATQTLSNMQKVGFKAGSVEDAGDHYQFDYEMQKDITKSVGTYYFCSNGKAFSAITVIGADTNEAKELVKSINPKQDKLFPKI